MRSTTRFCTLACGLLLSACSTSSHVLIGTPRPPISPDSVRVYNQPPSRYEEIATLNASSQGSFAITAQQNMDKAIQRLKEEAAKLGANGVLLGEVRTQQTGSIGTGVGSSNYGPSGGTSVGVGGSFGITNKAANALAIYVPPEAANAPPPPQPPPPQPPPSQPPPSQPPPK
jgi:uncharacterized protein YbjQ (UPF0145 family)